MENESDNRAFRKERAKYGADLPSKLLFDLDKKEESRFESRTDQDIEIAQKIIDALENNSLNSEKAVKGASQSIASVLGILAREMARPTKIVFPESIDTLSIKGKDGITPVAGKDYPSKKQISDAITLLTQKEASKIHKELFDYAKKIKGEKGDTGEKGKDGITPEYGVDYFTKKQAKEFLTLVIDTVKPLIKNGKDGKDGKDGSPDKPEDIRKKLESLKGNNRLDASSIKNIEKLLPSKKESVFIGGGGGSSTLGGKTWEDVENLIIAYAVSL